MTVNKPTIGIAGAGIAGLMAGRELQRAGHQVSIFEARSRTGGRIESLNVDGYIVEMGPEFIHGNLKETMALLKEYNIRYEAVEGKMYRAKDHRFVESYDVVEDWELLLDKMKSLKEDLPFLEFLILHFPGDRFETLRKSAIRFAEGFDLADTNTVSTSALFSEWEEEEAAQYRILPGYGELIHSIENEFKLLGGKIYLDHAVNRVDWNSNEIQVYTEHNVKFSVDKLIVSLPVSLLNQSGHSSESIIFSPALDEKEKAFEQIGFGSVIKMVLIFRSAFWKPVIPDARFILSDHFVPTWWTQYPLDIPILTGWLGGPRALALADQTETYFLDKALETLSADFSIPPEVLRGQLQNFRIFNWKNEPWSRGAYSYSLPGYQRAGEIYRKPIGNRIYFSGEAGYKGPYPGTVEAAVVSALETAGKLLAER